MEALYRFLSEVGLGLGASCLVVVLLGWIYSTFQVKRDLETFGHIKWTLMMTLLLTSMVAASLLAITILIVE